MRLVILHKPSGKFVRSWYDLQSRDGHASRVELVAKRDASTYDSRAQCRTLISMFFNRDEMEIQQR